MEPEFGYAHTLDGVYVGYLTLGEAPPHFAMLPEWPGNIDLEWDHPIGNAFLTALSSFCGVIFHEHRGVGLSSRNVALPNLETRAADLVSVLDAVGADRVALGGSLSSGATNALFAATYPKRVTALAWIDPSPRYSWAPDYPWGRTEKDVEDEMEELRLWGSSAYGRAFVEYETTHDHEAPDSEAAWLTRQSRNACTPDVAMQLTKIWAETDVREVLSAVSAPTILISGDTPRTLERSRYTASLLPNAELKVMADPLGSPESARAVAEELRRFLGVERPPAGLDTVLSTVLFTDIVESTKKQASLGDHAWKDLIERHHALVREALNRWHGVENDTAGDGFYATFDGPARAIRCALEVRDRVRELGIEIRAGIHTGECELIDGKIGGISVTIGARVAATAVGSEVRISQTVKDLVAGSGLTFQDAGDHELKGVPDRWHLYRVVP
jgi:class 3 adenylate cyclase